MVLKEWGEIQTLYKASLRRVFRAPFVLTKVRCYWYVWGSVGVVLSSVGLLFLLDAHIRSPWEQVLAGAPMGLAIMLMKFLFETALATEFKLEYDTHGLLSLPRSKRGMYLRYAFFLRGLAERGYARETIRKLKDFMLVAGTPAPTPQPLQHPLMVPILTIGTVLSIEAIKQSDIWLKTRYWWIFFYGLCFLGWVIAVLHGVSQLPKKSAQKLQQFLEWAERDIEDEQFLRIRRLRAEAPGPYGPSPEPFTQ
jgi:hypothetical protein